MRELQSRALENVSNIFQTDSNSSDAEENKRLRRYDARQALNYVQSELHERSCINEHNGFYKNRISYCMNRQFDSSKPTHLYSNGKITNLFFCQMAKCPVCSGKFFEQWKNDIDKVVSYMQKKDDIVYSDGLTMDAFRRMVNQKKNWVMINSKFSITNGGRTVEAREVYYDNGVVKVREANSPMNERVYEMDDALIQSFSTVCVQTIDNNVDREMRRQNKATSKEEMMAVRTGTSN